MLTEKEVRYIQKNVSKLSRTEIARRLGCRLSTVCRWIKKEKIPVKSIERWNSERREEILSLRQQGLSMREIAERMNVSQGSIRGQLNIMRNEGYNTPYREEWLQARRDNPAVDTAWNIRRRTVHDKKNDCPKSAKVSF